MPPTVNGPASVYRPPLGLGEMSNVGVFYIVDTLGNFIVDTVGNFITDIGSFLTSVPASVYAQVESIPATQYSANIPGNGEIVASGNSFIDTEASADLITQSGSNLIIEDTIYSNNPATAYSQNDAS